MADSQEASGVVHRALAFQQVGDALGHADSLGNRSSRQRVGRRDDRAQDQTESPVEPREQPLRPLCPPITVNLTMPNAKSRMLTRL